SPHFDPQLAAYLPRHPPVHRPECQTQVVPAKIAECPERFQIAVHSDVLLAELLGAKETKGRIDSADRPDTTGVLEGLTHTLQPPAVHEHDAIHVLHAVLLARLEDLTHLAGIAGRRFFS